MKTVMIAHRGAQEIAPENTLTAFELAIKRRFKAVECDVQLSKDGHLVIIHDGTVDRTTDGSGWISQLNYEQIRNLHITDTEHIPSLDEVFNAVIVRGKTKLIIEIKADSEYHSKKVAKALAEYLNAKTKKYNRYIEVHSFWYEALKQFKALCPTCTTAAVINGGFSTSQIIEIANDTNSDGVSLGYEFISNKIVKRCHKANLFVDTWAISDGVVLKRLRPFGINAMIENFTGKVIKI